VTKEQDNKAYGIAVLLRDQILTLKVQAQFCMNILLAHLMLEL